MPTLWKDIRYGFRMLLRSPGFTLLAVLTLALGIAANGTIFSWINSTLLNPIPGISRTADMITIERGPRTEHPSPPFSYPDFVDIRDATKTLDGLIGYHDDYVAITGSGIPQRFFAALTTANYFDVLGARPALGRTFLPSEESDPGAAVVVIGYDVWKTRFAGDPHIVGKSVEINLHPYQIIGIAPRHFIGCKSGLRTEMWFPVGMDQAIWGAHRFNDRGVSWLNVLGKLRPGIDRHQAELELNLVMQRIVDRYPSLHQGPNELSTDPLWRSPFGANVYLYGTLPILLCLAVVLLLLAGANVANLLLVRSISRRRELALRLSLGATRWQIFRQLLVETLFIALAAGAIAMLLTTWTAGTFGAFVPQTLIPLDLNGRADRTVFLVTLLISLLTAFVSGLIPALRTSSLSPITVLKDEAANTTGGPHRSRISSSLVVLQISLSFLLLICAGLFVRSLQNASKFDPGFDSNHVFLATFELDPLGYSDPAGLEFEKQLLSRIKALPGVESATLADFSPLNFTLHSNDSLPEGYVPRPHESMEMDRGIVGPNYLETMRTPLLAGRDFTERDTASAQPVVIINQAFIDRYWPGLTAQEAIGKRLRAGDQFFTVVGVAANAKYRRLAYDPAPLTLFALFQHYRDEAIIHVRTAGEPNAIGFAVQKVVHDLNPDVPLYNLTTLAASMQISSIFARVAATFAGSFGLLSLLLAGVGIYGVVAYTTKQRTHEIGIRMAIGAQRTDVLRQILAQGMRLAFAGLLVGLAVSYVLTRFLRGVLFGVGATDTATFALVAFLLCLVTLLACYIPARRATRVDPMAALHYE